MQLQATLPDGAKILLRPPREADIPAIFEGANSSHAELAPWMPWCDESFSIETAETWVKETTANDAERAFTVWDETETQFLGNCGLHEMQPKLRSAAMGYWVRTDQVGRGIASAAARAVANYAFSELDLVRVQILIAVGNEPSRRVAEKLNATREGILRNGLMHGEKVRDAELYSLIPEDIV